MWVLADVLLFIGLFLAIFPEKFLSYDSKHLPNFWDHRHKGDIFLTNWKTRRKFTILVGIAFIIASLLVFWSIYNSAYIKFA